MPTPFTVARNGPWDASGGVDTWGQGVGVYPQTAGDVMNIGYNVTYNVVSAVEMGQINFTSANGLLTFATDRNTKLTLGHANIVGYNGAELRIGAPGAVIDKAYTAELVWNPTADGAKGITSVGGFKFTTGGDPAYNSIPATQLYSDWNGSNLTIYVKADVSAAWVTGQRLIIHKGRAYGTNCEYPTGFAVVSVNGAPTWDGTKSTVTITLINVPNTTTSFLANGDVLNVSKNVRVYKLAASENWNTGATNKPYIQGGALTTYSINNCDFLGVIVSCLATWDRCSLRNFYHNLQEGNLFTDCVFACSIGSIFFNNYIRLTNSYIIGGQNSFGYASYPYLLNCRLYGNGSVVNSVYPMTESNIRSSYFYSNSNTIMNIAGIIRDSYIGFDEFGNTKANQFDFNYIRAGCVLINCKVPATPIFINRNTPFRHQIAFKHEDYNQSHGAHHVDWCFGTVDNVIADGSDDNPSQRVGGGDTVLEVVPQSLCSSDNYVQLFNIRLWAAAASAKTYRFYIQTDYATLPTAELILYAEYLNAVSGGALTTLASTQNITTRANAADWSQYVEVVIPATYPKQAGYVNLYLRLMGYEAGKKVWVDPLAVITGTDTITPRWSLGEVVLDIDPAATGGGVFPIIGGSHIIQPARVA